jgi:hypothetical protein
MECVPVAVDWVEAAVAGGVIVDAKRSNSTPDKARRVLFIIINPPSRD